MLKVVGPSVVAQEFRVIFTCIGAEVEPFVIHSTDSNVSRFQVGARANLKLITVTTCCLENDFWNFLQTELHRHHEFEGQAPSREHSTSFPT